MTRTTAHEIVAGIYLGDEAAVQKNDQYASVGLLGNIIIKFKFLVSDLKLSSQ